MASHRPPQHLHSVLANLAEEALAEGKVRVGLLKQGKVVLHHLLTVPATYLSYLQASNRKSVVLCESGKDLFLLSLVLQNVSLFLPLSQALPAEEGVASGNDDGGSVHLGDIHANTLPDEHHGPIPDPWVSHLLVVSLI